MTQARLYRILKYLSISAASVIPLLGLLELAIRAYSGLFFVRMMVLDDKLGWRHAQNVSKTFRNEDSDYIPVIQNANGHRGGYYGPVKPIGKYRILAIGDSFTEGVQVKDDELFSARLEKTDPELE